MSKGKRFGSVPASSHSGAGRNHAYSGHHKQFLGWEYARWSAPYLGVVATQIGATLIREFALTDDLERLALMALISVAGYGLTRVIDQYAAARHVFIGPHMRLTVWTLIGCATVTMILGWPSVWRYVCPVALITLCLSWNLRKTDALRERENTGETKESEWDRIGLKDIAPVGKPKTTDVSTEVVVRGKYGRKAKDIIATVPALTAHLGLRPGAITAVASQDRASDAVLSITPKDHLKGDAPRPPWDGMRYSFAEGVPLGVFEHGPHFRLTLIRGALLRVSSHLQVMAMSQAGKSHLFQLFVRGITETDDAVLWVGDPIKAAETCAGILPAFDRLEITAGGINKMMSDIERIITFRTRYLSQVRINGERITGWQPGCGLPILIVWIEESRMALAGSDKWTQLAMAALSSGIILIDSTQRADHEAKKTSARAQYASAICGGVKDEIDQGFVLPGYIADQVKCHEWGTRFPGRFIQDCACSPEELKVRPWRTYFAPGMQRENEAAIRANAPGMAQLDEGSRSVCNDYVRNPGMEIFGWTDTDGDGEPDVSVIVRSVRPERSVRPSGAVRPSVRPASTDAVVVHPTDVVRPEPMFTVEEEMEPSEEDVREAAGERPDERSVWDDIGRTEREALAQADADVESGILPPAPEGVSWPGPPEGSLTPEQHRDAVRVALIAECRSASSFSTDRYPLVKMESLMDRLSGIPGFLRSRPWVHSYLRAMEEQGDVRPVGGGWYAVLLNPELDPIPIPESDDGADERVAALFSDTP